MAKKEVKKTKTKKETAAPDIYKLSKEEIVTRITEVSDFNKGEATKAYAAVFEAVKDMIIAGCEGSDGCELTVTGFGVFSSKRTKERPGVNFHTKEKLIVPAGRDVRWSASKTFKDLVKAVDG